MRLLLDQGLPRSEAELLREAGHDAIHTASINVGGASDQQILTVANAEGRIVVTLDADFHRLLALSGAKSPSTIRIRIEGLTQAPLATLIVGVLVRCAKALLDGAAVTVESSRVRVRRLPIERR